MNVARAKERVRCERDHAEEIPVAVAALPESQAAFWRHKCAGCAYLLGKQDAQAEADLRIAALEAALAELGGTSVAGFQVMDKKKKGQLEGEGSYTASKSYDKAAEDFAKSGKVDKAAREAESAFDATEGSGLREAETEGKSHAKEEDRLLRETDKDLLKKE
jgi:hypothetical protein